MGNCLYPSPLDRPFRTPQDLADCKSSMQQQQLRAACDVCHRMKRKCDGKQPCTRCDRHNRDCAYSCKQKSGPPKGSKRKLVEAEDDLPENRKILGGIRHDQSNNEDRCSSSSNSATKKSNNSKIRSTRPQRHPLNTWPQAKDEEMEETWSGNDDDDDDDDDGGDDDDDDDEDDEETTVDTAADTKPPPPAIFNGTPSPFIMRPAQLVAAPTDPAPSPEAMAAAAAVVAASRINAAFPKSVTPALVAAGIGSQFMPSGTAASLVPGVIGSGGSGGLMPIVSGGLMPNHGHSHPQYGTMYQLYPPEVYALYLAELRQRGGVGMVHNNNLHGGGNHVSNGVGKVGPVVGETLISEPIRMAHAPGMTQYGNSLVLADMISSQAASVPVAGFAATGAGIPAKSVGWPSSSFSGGHTGSLLPPPASETVFAEEVNWVEHLRKADTPAAVQGLSVSSLSSSSPSPSLFPPPHASAENKISHTANDTGSGILLGVTKSVDGGCSAAATVTAACALATAVAVAIAEDLTSCKSLAEKVLELPTPLAPTISSASPVSSPPSAPSVPPSSSAPSAPSDPSNRACVTACRLGTDARAGPKNGAAASNNDTNNTNNNDINYRAPVAGGISPAKGHGSGDRVIDAAPTAAVSETTNDTSVCGDVKGMKSEGEHEACVCCCTTDREREAALGMVLHSNRSTTTVTADASNTSNSSLQRSGSSSSSSPARGA